MIKIYRGITFVMVFVAENMFLFVVPPEFPDSAIFFSEEEL